jgi:hypothetical protein
MDDQERKPQVVTFSVDVTVPVSSAAGRRLTGSIQANTSEEGDR